MKRNLQKRPVYYIQRNLYTWNETYKRDLYSKYKEIIYMKWDLQKRPIYSKYKKKLYTWNETYKRDLYSKYKEIYAHKTRPTKETYVL